MRRKFGIQRLNCRVDNESGIDQRIDARLKEGVVYVMVKKAGVGR